MSESIESRTEQVNASLYIVSGTNYRLAKMSSGEWAVLDVVNLTKRGFPVAKHLAPSIEEALDHALTLPVTLTSAGDESAAEAEPVQSNIEPIEPEGE